jgi:tRNA pseudouridine38-40 synthase
VVHLDVPDDVLRAVVGRSAAPPVDALVRRLNGVLPADVRVRGGREAPDGFDARFSALWRRYAYRIADDQASVDPLVRHSVLARARRLDLQAMNTAAGWLVGEHDFAAFCKRRDGATTIRTLLALRWARDETGLAVAEVRADAFCHHMVRALVGCLVVVGEGRRPPEWAAEVLRRGVRDVGVSVVPAHGLTLEEVAYPADADLARQALATRRVRVAAESADG